MLGLVVTLLIIALIAAVLGFGGIAFAAVEIATHHDRAAAAATLPSNRGRKGALGRILQCPNFEVCRNLVIPNAFLIGP
jgi:hypothetical protein